MSELMKLSDEVEAFNAQLVEKRTPHHSMNGYLCEVCGRVTLTIDVHAGVTPFLLGCRATPDCKGTGRSLMYPPGPIPPQYGAPLWEWARPTEEEFDELSAPMQEHVLRGGLVLRPRTGLPGAYAGAEAQP